MASVVVFDTREFEEEFVADSFKPLTPAERARWRRVRGKAKAKAASAFVQVEPRLLKRLDALSKQMGISPEALVARGIKAVLAQSRKM